MATYKNILVPYDGSDHAREALKTAIDLVKDEDDAKVRILNVIASSDVAPGYGEANPFWTSADLMDYDQYKKMMVGAIEGAKNGLKKDLKDELEELGDKAILDVMTYPSTANAIADYAEKNDVDLIVMGRRGLGSLRGMLGSVCYRLLGLVDCPVLTIK